jgi:hypothetical protein
LVEQYQAVEKEVTVSVAEPTSPKAGPPVPRMLLSRQEAAAVLGMSLSHFQRHVQPYVPCVYSGHLRLYRPRDLERWAEAEAYGRGRAA